MKIAKLLLVVLLALWVVCLGTILTPRENVEGVVHPKIASMRHGGDPERHSAVLGWGWGFGALMITSVVALIAFGARKDERLHGGLGWWLLGGLLAYLAAWTWLVLAYERYVHDPSPALYLYLPAPSAIMLYVLFPVSVLFNLLFVAAFRRSIFSVADEAAYERLVAERRARRRHDPPSEGPRSEPRQVGM